MRSRYGVVAALTVVATMMLMPSGASAAHHFMKIREVFPGSKATPTVQWIELQMYKPGQNFVSGQNVAVYNAFGTINAVATFDSDVPNGQNQRSILIGSPDTPGKDLMIEGPMMDPFGGAVCFESIGFGPIDCVSWGSFDPSAPPVFRRSNPYPGPSLPNALPGGIPDGNSLERTIEPNCPTLLQGEDDTDSSLADFGANPLPTPRNNATTPTETECVSKLTAKRKQKVKRRKVRIKGKFIAAQPGQLRITGKGKPRSKLKLSSVTVARGSDLGVQAGDQLSFKLKASRKNSKRLCRKKKGKVIIKAQLTDNLGETESHKKTVRVRCRGRA